MPLVNEKSTVIEIKDYIRSHKLKIKLSQKKADLLNDLEKEGHLKKSASKPVKEKVKSKPVKEKVKSKPVKEKVKKPRALKIQGNDKQYNVVYDVAGITIKIDYNISNKKGLYLLNMNNSNPKKKGQARVILHDIVNYLYSLGKVNLNDSFELKAESPKQEGFSQEGLVNMYKKLGFKITSDNNMEQTIKNFLKK